MKARVLKVRNVKAEEVCWEVLPASLQQYLTTYTVNVNGMGESCMANKKISKSATSCLGSTGYLTWFSRGMVCQSAKAVALFCWQNAHPFRDSSSFLESRGICIAWVMSLSVISGESHTSASIINSDLFVYTPCLLFLRTLVNMLTPSMLVTK